MGTYVDAKIYYGVPLDEEAEQRLVGDSDDKDEAIRTWLEKRPLLDIIWTGDLAWWEQPLALVVKNSEIGNYESIFQFHKDDLKGISRDESLAILGACNVLKPEAEPTWMVIWTRG